MPSLAVILPAAGSSTRFGGSQSKLLSSLDGMTVLARSVAAFSRRPDVAITIVVGTGIAGERIIACPGGSCRAESVRNGLMRVPEGIEWVAVHDAARPLVSQDLIDRTFAAAREHGAAVPALPVAQTIKQSETYLPARVGRTIPREQLWATQTPQIMRRAALLRAFERCPVPLSQVTDDAQLLELDRQEVWLVPGEERNLKITTPMDLAIARAWLEREG